MEWAQEVELVQTLEGVALAVKASKDNPASDHSSS